MALTYRTKNQANLGSGDPITVALTTQAGDSLLVCFISSATTAARTGGSPTWNGVALTQAGTAQAGSAECNSELWYMLNPALGSYNVSVPNTGTKATRVMAAVFTGSPPALFGTPQQTGTSGANPACTINSVPIGGLAAAVDGGGYKDPPTGRSYTSLYENDEGVYSTNAQYGEFAVVTNVTMGWSFAGSDDVSMVMAAWCEDDLALSKTATASSVFGVGFEAAKAVDGNYTTYWSSITGHDPEWIYVDLANYYTVERIKLVWEPAYGDEYQLQVSNNASDWTDVYSTASGNGGTDDITLVTPTVGRYVRMYGTSRGTAYGYAIYDFEVYGTLLLVFSPSVTNTLDLSDNVSVGVSLADLAVEVTDSLDLADSTAGEMSLWEISASDTLDMADDPAAELSLWEAVAGDAMDLADAATAELSLWEAVITDTLDLADGSEGVVPLIPADVADALDVADTAAAEVTGEAAAQAAEALDLAESVTLEATPLEIAVSDTLDAADNPAAEMSLWEASASDALDLADNAAGEMSLWEIGVADSLAVAEAAAGELDIVPIEVSDALAMAESLTVAADMQVIVQVESMDLADTASAQLTVLEPEIADALDLADSAEARLTPLAAEVADGLGLDEGLSIYQTPLTVSLADQVGLAETAAVETNPLEVAVADAMGVEAAVYLTAAAGIVLVVGMNGGMRDLCGGITA